MESSRKPLSTTHSQTILGKALFQLSDFGAKSLNLGVLVNDQSMRKAYSTAVAEGELPTNRARVLLLGEPRAGKTSLLNRLLGREFDIHEQPTHGIETRMCHVTNVDKQWNESGGVKADDIRECASAVTVLQEASSDGHTRKGDLKRNNNKPPSTSSESSESHQGIEFSLNEIVPQFVFFLKLLISIFFLYYMLEAQYGYVVLVWSCIGALSLLIDYNNAYRLATACSFGLIFWEATLRIDKPLNKLLACKNTQDSSNNYYLALHLSKGIFFNAMYTAITGVSCGLGFRTGIAVAFCACVHPLGKQELFVRSVASWNMVVLSLVFGVSGVISLAIYKYCTVNDRWHIKRTVTCCGFMILVYAVYLGTGCRYRPYWFVFLNSFFMTFLTTWGSIFGRRVVLKYGFEASYVTKKTIGFAIGLYLAYKCGWTLQVPIDSWSSVTIYILSVAAHPLFDLHITYNVWRAKSTFPVKTIREQIKAASRGQPLLETKLSLWDFAGDSLYHCTHHVFMPDRALYVIVFDLEAAVSNEDEQLQKLLFWLHSVCAHARHPDAVVMVVGTHKASVTETSRKTFSNNLHHRITPQFCHRLVLNPIDDRPLFLVENSEPFDQEYQQLRAEIFRRVESAEYAQEKYPIKYLHFYREIQDRRKLAHQTSDCSLHVATLREIEDLARTTCEVEGDDQLKKMLMFFCEAGEIIYREEDEVLRQHVVLDPQLLVDVMKQLVDIPRGSHRSHRYAIQWRNYENTGIISEELLQHIYRDKSNLVPLFTHLLRAYDLMCSIAPIVNPNSPPNLFLVPAMLPSFHGDEMTFWESLSDEEVFYFDFGFFDPRTIYYRLLTRCLTSACLDKMEQNSLPLIFADRCRFHIATSYIFKIQLEKRTSQQQLISVTVLTFEPEHPGSKLLEFLVSAVRSIIVRDYPNLHFTFGPRCSLCVKSLSSRDEPNYRQLEAIHVLNMADNDKAFPTMSPVVMLCGQKRCEISLTRCQTTRHVRSPSQPPRRVAFGPDTKITKLPPDLFHKVCRLLNARQGNRNWKTFAGELGKDVEFVAGLDSEMVSNPSEHLLKEWAMEGDVTVADLLQVLDRPSLQRTDIIQEVLAQMS